MELFQDGEKAWDVDHVINKVNKLHEQYGCLSLDDVPSQTLKSQEVPVCHLTSQTTVKTVLTTNETFFPPTLSCMMIEIFFLVNHECFPLQHSLFSHVTSFFTVYM